MSLPHNHLIGGLKDTMMVVRCALTSQHVELISETNAGYLLFRGYSELMRTVWTLLVSDYYCAKYEGAMKGGVSGL